MRTSKIAAIVAAAALLVLGAAFTSMAATGWQEESGTWVYYDKNGELVTEDWAKSGSYWYWLDEDGYMATDQLIEDDDKYYYVDESGRMVTNQWRLLPNNDDEDLFEDEIWYYFQASGKAYKAGDSGIVWKTINGKKYGFDDQARMLFGWIAEDGTMVDADEELKYQDGMYFCGDNMDGHRRQNEWEQMYVDDGEGNDKNWWFYFNANGKKVVNNGNKSINGKKYAFAADGHMLSEWVEVSSTGTPTITNFKYFSSPEEGAKYTKGWFWVVPDEAINYTDSDKDEENNRWFYAKGNGELYYSTLKTINGKVYGFKADGEMVAGAYWCGKDAADSSTWTFTKLNTEEKMDAKTDLASFDGSVPDAETKTGLRFFGSEYPDGSMKTGNMTITVDGEEYKMKFKTKGALKGTGIHGKDGNNFYLNGLKITADADQKYQLFPVTTTDGKDMITGAGENASAHVGDVTDKYVLLSKTGSLIKSGTKTDADEYKITVKGGYVTKVAQPKD